MHAVLFWVFRGMVAFFALGVSVFWWRLSVTLAACLLIDLFGMLVAVVPPNNVWSHLIVNVLAGLVLGASVMSSPDRDEPHKLPRLAALVMTLLSVSWGASWDDALDLWWLLLCRLLAFPGGMYLVIRSAQRRSR